MNKVGILPDEVNEARGSEGAEDICKEGLTMKDTVSKLSKQRSMDMRRGRTMGKR